MATLIRNTSQVVTMASGGRPKRRHDLNDPGVIEGGAVLIRDGRIAAVGSAADLAPDASHTIDAEGGVVLPGFVDPHMHLVFAGSRPRPLFCGRKADWKSAELSSAFERV